MKSAFILGTRPEIIKLCPVIRAHLTRGFPFRIIHTNQHYSPALDAVFFEQLRLPAAEVNLGVGSGSHGRQLGQMLERLEPALREYAPEAVFVQGDTNSVLAGALIASRLGLPLAHVEAGLRSYDRRMPEEANRRLVDHLADFLLAPTEGCRQIMLGEGLPAARIHVTGNTIVDVLRELSAEGGPPGPMPPPAGLAGKDYLLVTLHRPENVDHRETLAGILAAIDRVAGRHGLAAVFPLHPRTAARLEEFGLRLPGSFLALGAADYFSFLALERGARLVVTDSGGVQEEACVLRVPCVTVRLSTERPETVAVGANLVAGVEPEAILAAAEKMLERRGGWENPLGDGRAGERIVDIVAGELADGAYRW